MSCLQCGGRLPEGARFCPACGDRVTVAPSSGERKLVTVVFCDLVGSTALSGTLDPEALRSVMLQYFTAMRTQVEEYGGTVEKFIGDAVMAIFGVPAMHDDDARRAAEAALGMRAALAVLNAELEPALNVRLRVRIGVHTGLVVTSPDVASQQAMASGDTVNIAARLQQSAGEGEILIGPLTREAIGATARTEEAGQLRLKGVKAPVMAYRLLAITEDVPELGRRFDVPFIGRHAELAMLDRALEEADRAGPRVVAICGEPGMGKTRLVRAWLDRTQHPLRHGGGRCRPYGDHGSLAPLAEAARALLAEPGARDRCAPGTLAVLDASLLRDGTPGPSLEATCGALAWVLEMLSAEQAIVVSLDDFQWAGDLLLDAVARLASSGCPRLMFLCLSRTGLPERWPTWSRPLPVTINVPPLSVTECGDLVSVVADATVHGANSASAIFDITGGNPFHIEQIIAAADDMGGSRRIPPSLQALLGARIDALHAVDRGVLDLAAVLGREFAPAQVSALASASPEGQQAGLRVAGGIAASLGVLRQRRLVEHAERPGIDRVMRFSSGLIHEATYRAMTKQNRAERHERAADVLSGEQADDAVIALHLERAYRYRSGLGLRDGRAEGLRVRAAGLLSSLGSQALNGSDLEWARALLSRAQALQAPHEAGWIVTTRQLGEVALASGDLMEGAKQLRSVLRSSPDEVESAFARLALAAAGLPETRGAQTAPVARVAREALPVFEATASDLGQARASIRLAQEQQLLGRHADAVRLLDRGIRHAVAAGAEQERALALGALGISLWRGQTPVPAAITRSRGLLAEHGTPRPTVRLTLNCPLAVVLALDDQWKEARECLAAAGSAAAELAYAEAAVVVPIFQAAVESIASQHQVALELLDQANREAQRIGATGFRGAIARESARLLLDLGRVADAAARISASGPEGELLCADRADFLALRARVAAARGDAGTALDLARTAASEAAKTDSPLVAASVAMDEARVLMVAGQRRQAKAAAATALRLCEEKGDRPGARRAGELIVEAGPGPRSSQRAKDSL